jgi:hypothetical protein
MYRPSRHDTSVPIMGIRGTVITHVVDIRRALDGSEVVEVTLDLSAPQLSAGAHAVRAAVEQRYRLETLESSDDILAMRELTSLGDDLDVLAAPGAHNRLTLTVAGAGRLRAALEDFAASRSEGAVREGDAEALPHVYAMIDGVADAQADALQAALGEGHNAVMPSPR